MVCTTKIRVASDYKGEKEERFRSQSGLRKGPTGFSCKEIRLNVMRQANSKKKRVWACGGGRQACSALESRSERKGRQCVLPLSFINLRSSAIVLPSLRLQHDQSRVTRRRTRVDIRLCSALATNEDYVTYVVIPLVKYL